MNESQTKPARFAGLIAAPFTSMNGDYSVNLDMVKRQAEALVSGGVSGAFICGTTGEGMSLTSAERMQLAERWVAVAPPSLKVIVHVGHQSLAESQALAAHAQRSGAQAIAAMAPNFFKPASLEQLVDYCGQIASSAPNLPFFYYHIPCMTGVEFSMYEFLKLASKRISNLAGLKFTHDNLMDYARCVQFENGRYTILFGRDEMLLSALAMGATGAVGSTYNYMAPLYVDLIKAFKAGDLAAARQLQLAAIEIVDVMLRHGGMSAGKAMMQLIGLDCGPLRPPLRTLPPEAFKTLQKALEAVGFPGRLGRSSART